MTGLPGAEASSIDDVWTLLRKHLDWTVGHPSLIFVTAGNREHLADLVDRVALYAARTRQSYRELDAWSERTVHGTLAEALPAPGVTVIRLPWTVIDCGSSYWGSSTSCVPDSSMPAPAV